MCQDTVLKLVVCSVVFTKYVQKTTETVANNFVLQDDTDRQFHSVHKVTNNIPQFPSFAFVALINRVT